MVASTEKFLELISNFYEEFYGGVAKSVNTLADIEKNYPDEYKKIKGFADDPNIIAELTEELPLEKQAILLKILLKSGKFSKDFINLLNLNEDQKRKLAQELINFARDIKKDEKKETKVEEKKK